MAYRKPLEFLTTPTGCTVPKNHKLNSDGYFRKRFSSTHIEMYHRYVWRKAHGEIPEGFEVDHKCGNRACCNLNHLQMLEGTAHTILTNETRYQARLEEALAYIKANPKVTGTKLGEIFGVSFSTGCRWKRLARAS